MRNMTNARNCDETSRFVRSYLKKVKAKTLESVLRPRSGERIAHETQTRKRCDSGEGASGVLPILRP